MSDITEKAILIKLSISQWTGRKYDRKVSHEIAENHGVSADVGRYNKLLIDSTEIKKVAKAVNAARGFFYDHTLPWGNDYRIRPTAGYMEFIAKLSEFQAEYDARVQEFCEKYADLIEQARRELKDMYNPGEYPVDIRRRFGFGVSVLPLAGSSDFRVNLSREEVQKMGEALDKQNKLAMQGAMETAWRRLYDAVNHMAGKLADNEGKFKNTLVDNLEELSKVLPILNIADDPELTRLCKEVEYKLCAFEPDTLRKDASARAETGKFAHTLAREIKQSLDKQAPAVEEDIFDSILNM